MVKHELVDALVEAFPGITKQDMSAVVDAFFDGMARALMRGESIELRGLGRFRIKERGPMKGRNPKTEATVDVPARWIVHFRPAEKLTKQING